MPAFVNTPEKEKHWEHAKKWVDEGYPDVKKDSDEYWALVNGIFQKKYHKKKGSRLVSIQSLASELNKSRLIIDLSVLYERNHH